MRVGVCLFDGVCESACVCVRVRVAVCAFACARVRVCVIVCVRVRARENQDVTRIFPSRSRSNLSEVASDCVD